MLLYSIDLLHLKQDWDLADAQSSLPARYGFVGSPRLCLGNC